jgi:hypothetical protein
MKGVQFTPTVHSLLNKRILRDHIAKSAPCIRDCASLTGFWLCSPNISVAMVVSEGLHLQPRLTSTASSQLAEVFQLIADIQL